MKTAPLIFLCILASIGGWKLGTRRPDLPAGSHRSSPELVSSAVATSEIAEAIEGSSAELEQTARNWAYKNPRKFLAWLSASDPIPDRSVTTAFFTSWVTENPDAAFNAVLDLPPKFPQFYLNNVRAAMLYALLNVDAMAAFAWVGQIQDYTILQNQAADWDWPESEASKLAEALTNLPRGNATDMLILQFARRFAERDFESARKWALGLSPAKREWALSPVLREWAKRDLPAALEYLQNTAPSSIRQGLGAVVLQAYARRDPIAALEWVDTHHGVPGASRLVLDTWMLADSNSVTDFVQSIDDPQRKGAVTH